MDNEQTPALREAVENMANMREVYNNLSQAAEAYNVGKTELAANINSKGVEASATETLPELARKVLAISQESYTIQGGEIYGNQLFGEGGLWNLYDILMQLLSDGRLVQYGGILLAEYYRGYDSLVLSGAGAGGAYVVSDLDENGQFKMYTNDTTHTWEKEFDGKCNRWVAYCFADEYHDFAITDTNTCPRSIYIGRKVGVLSCLVAGRIDSIVVPDGSELSDIQMSNTQNYGQKLVIRNLGEHLSGLIASSATTSALVYLSLGFKTIKAALFNGDRAISNLNAVSFNELEEIAPDTAMGGFFGTRMFDGAPNLSVVQFPKLKLIRNTGYGTANMIFLTPQANNKLQTIDLPVLEEINTSYLFGDGNTTSNHLRSLHMPSLKRQVNPGTSIISAFFLYDIEVGEMETNLILNYWYPQETTKLTNLTAIPETIRDQVLDNIYNHIALKVSDRTGLSSLVVQFTAEVKNSILAEEGQRIINKFTEKNWTIA